MLIEAIFKCWKESMSCSVLRTQDDLLTYPREMAFTSGLMLARLSICSAKITIDFLAIKKIWLYFTTDLLWMRFDSEAGTPLNLNI